MAFPLSPRFYFLQLVHKVWLEKFVELNFKIYVPNPIA